MREAKEKERWWKGKVRSKICEWERLGGGNSWNPSGLAASALKHLGPIREIKIRRRCYLKLKHTFYIEKKEDNKINIKTLQSKLRNE